MSTVKEPTLSPDGIAAVPVDAGADDEAGADDDAGADVDGGADDVDEEVEEEQPAAATTATTVARASQPTRGEGRNVPWPCERECPPPCLLLSKSIPYPFRKVLTDEPNAGHMCPLREER
jgi:hypothetical protein